MRSPIEVAVWHGSIGDADVDVLVNASNTILKLGSGVSYAIGQSCGPGFQGVLDALLRDRYRGGLEPGAVVMTDAHQHLRAKDVAHVAVMDYREGAHIVSRPDADRLRRGYDALFAAIAASPDGPHSVAVVALGAGTGGFGLRQSVGLACERLAHHLETAGGISQVLFVAYDALECANTFEAVKEHFDVDPSTLSADVRSLLGL
jgi:O-acetyl-ADP-ribose deacetylase (regulator of RNase III)